MLTGDGSQLRPEMIPWPVQSGRWEDVTEFNVTEFFSRGMVIPETPESGELRFKAISAENLRWHTDKVMSKFGSDIFESPYEPALNCIARILVGLWKEARESRRR
jgi:hypothetical protein